MSPARAAALGAIRRRLRDASSVVLTTHVNPDGDGIGSMVALASRLLRHGAEATIVTPSRPPASLRFLLRDIPALVEEDPAAADPLNGADTIAILDTAEPKRLGNLPGHAERTGGVLIDHHPPVGLRSCNRRSAIPPPARRANSSTTCSRSTTRAHARGSGGPLHGDIDGYGLVPFLEHLPSRARDRERAARDGGGYGCAVPRAVRRVQPREAGPHAAGPRGAGSRSSRPHRLDRAGPSGPLEGGCAK